MRTRELRFAAIQLPEGASIARTQAVMDKLIPQIKDIPGVKFVMGIKGYSIIGGASENMGTIIMPLEHWERESQREKSLQSYRRKDSCYRFICS